MSDHIELAAILIRVKLETYNFHYPSLFMNTSKKRYDSIGFGIYLFVFPIYIGIYCSYLFVTPQTPIFGESRKCSDAWNITTFGHINIPRSLVIKFNYKLGVGKG